MVKSGGSATMTHGISLATEMQRQERQMDRIRHIGIISEQTGAEPVFAAAHERHVTPEEIEAQKEEDWVRRIERYKEHAKKYPPLTPEEQQAERDRMEFEAEEARHYQGVSK